MRTILVALFVMVCFTLQSQEKVQVSLDVDGVERIAYVYLNADYENGDEWPLVINMHGRGSSAIEQEIYSYFTAVADTSQFILVFPEGLTADGVTHWNSGFGTGVDDLGFMDQLIDHMHLNYNIDLSRVYATGMSNGGYMSYTMACEMSDRIAAIASVTGAMVIPQQESCNPGYVAPIMQIHGTNDDTVLFDGSGFHNPIDDLVSFWLDKHNCSEDNEYIEYPDINTSDNTTIESFHYTDCDAEGEVKYYIVDGGGHTWPGAFAVAVLGPVNQDILASNHIWNFLRKFQHPNPLVVSNVLENQNVSLDVYPNPASDFIFINTSEIITSVEIFNSVGELIVIEKDVNRKIDVRNLHEGIYILKFKLDNGNTLSEKVSLF